MWQRLLLPEGRIEAVANRLKSHKTYGWTHNSLNADCLLPILFWHQERILLYFSKSYWHKACFTLKSCLFVRHSPVAQSVEQVAVNHPVGGSNPSRGDKCGTEMYRISFSGRDVKKRLQILQSLSSSLPVSIKAQESLQLCPGSSWSRCAGGRLPRTYHTWRKAKVISFPSL